MTTNLPEGTMTVTLEILDGPKYRVDDDGWKNHTYKIRLHCEGRFMDTEWHQGLGITEDPTAASVLENLLSEAGTYEYESFEEWADNYGFDTDSRKAERMYHAVQEQTKHLRVLLGESNWEGLADAEDTEDAARRLTV